MILSQMTSTATQYGGGDEYEWILVLALIVLFRIMVG